MHKKEDKIISQEEYEKLVTEFAEKETRLEEKLWIDSNLTKLDDVLRLNYNKSVSEFATVVLRYIAELSNAFSGTFFFYDKEKRHIEAIAGYAHNINKLQKKYYQVGEGVIGQVIVSKKNLFFDNIPAENVQTSLSTVAIEVSNVLIFPLIFNEQVHGVIELVYIYEISEKNITLLGSLSRNIAVMLESISKNEMNRKLLFESQEATEALRAQEEEMRQNMEELQATQEAMKQKQKEVELANEKLKRNEDVLRKSIQKAKEQEIKLKEANAELATREEEMRQNLEELSATQETLEKQKKELEQKDKKMQILMQEMKINEEDMQQNEQKMRKVIKDFQIQRKEMKEKDKLIEKLQTELEKLKIKS